MRRGRTIGTEERDEAHNDVFEMLNLLDNAMERAMRNQEPMIFPDEIEEIQKVPNNMNIAESMMEHGHAESND